MEMCFKRARSRFPLAALLAGFCASFCLFACMHNFDVFGPGPADGEATDGAGGDGGTGGEGGCTPSADCLDAATKCATTCKQQNATCEAGCTPAPSCWGSCGGQLTSCTTSCTIDCTACTTSASCYAPSACNYAVQ
jgi:hypothetical protein